MLAPCLWTTRQGTLLFGHKIPTKTTPMGDYRIELFSLVLSLNTSLSSFAYASHIAPSLLGLESYHFINTLFYVQLTH